MSKSYMTGQILLDRVNKISQNPKKENLVILGRGATDFKSEELMKKELESLSDYIKQRIEFKKIQTGVYYSYNSKEKCLSQFPPLLAPESSPRRTSAPLPPREEPPRCKSSRKENYGGFAMFFFNTKIASASARARVLEH